MSRATEKQYYKDIIKKAVPAKAVAPSKAPTKACTPSKAPKKIPTAPPAAPPKKVKYYIPGVIVDGQSYYEDNKGVLIGVLGVDIKCLHLYKNKGACRARAEILAKQFGRDKKARPFVATYKLDE